MPSINQHILYQHTNTSSTNQKVHCLQNKALSLKQKLIYLITKTNTYQPNSVNNSSKMALALYFQWKPMSDDNAPDTPISQEQQAPITRRKRRRAAKQKCKADAAAWMAAGEFFLNGEE
jgi:hypothetical protein